MKSKTPVVLITGCSSGIGEALCREFHRRNCKVIATARRLDSLEGLRAEGMNTQKLDVNNRDDITRVVRTVLEDSSRIDVLVNNAGYALIGPAIELSDSKLRSQLETNLIAPLALTKEVAPSMKEKGQGKIVNIGSISGIVTTPFSGAYCASKAALHSISDALRMELSPFGIRVITVQPGAIQSQFGKTASHTAKESLSADSWYIPVQEDINARAELSQENATSAEEFSRVLVTMLLEDNPHPIIRLGKQSRLLPTLKKLLPVSVLDKIFTKKFNLDTIKKGLSIMKGNP